MDFEAQPLLDDDAGMYPMPMLGGDEGFGGPEPSQAPMQGGGSSAPTAQPVQSSYQLPAATERPHEPKQEPLRTLPAPPPMLSDAPQWAQPMQRPQGVQPQHAPTQRPHHHRGRHPGMRGFGDDTPQSASNLLGLALVAVPVGGYVGYRYAGALGVLGGMLAAGGLVNGVRAARGLTSPPTDPSETWVSATFAVLGLGAAAYLLYRGSRPSSSRHEANKKTESTALAHAENKHRL